MGALQMLGIAQIPPLCGLRSNNDEAAPVARSRNCHAAAGNSAHRTLKLARIACDLIPPCIRLRLKKGTPDQPAEIAHPADYQPIRSMTSAILEFRQGQRLRRSVVNRASVKKLPPCS